MILIYNGAALVVGLLAAAVWGVSITVSPDLIESDGAAMLAAAVSLFVIGAAAEEVGIHGRFFWLPIWTWGVVMVAVHVAPRWGWLASAAAIASGIVYWVLSEVVILLREERQWAYAPLQLTRLREADVAADFWTLAAEAHFVPSWTVTREISRHNAQVMDVVLARDDLTEGERDVLARLRTVYDAAVRARKPGRTMRKGHRIFTRRALAALPRMHWRRVRALLNGG